MLRTSNLIEKIVAYRSAVHEKVVAESLVKV